MNGIEAIERFRKEGADIIITDLIMSGKEGLESIRELKAIAPDVSIFAISGGGLGKPATYLDLAKELGAARTFSKPVDNEILLLAVKKVLG